MKEFLEALAALLERYGVELHPESDQDGCDLAIQFWRPNVENPWMDSVDIDNYVTAESIKKYLKKENP